jgi:hypothetical protein
MRLSDRPFNRFRNARNSTLRFLFLFLLALVLERYFERHSGVSWLNHSSPYRIGLIALLHRLQTEEFIAHKPEFKKSIQAKLDAGDYSY